MKPSAFGKALFFLLSAITFALASCGGGGGGSASSGSVSGGGSGSSSFSVGGTVSGLDGTLVLQNNGADDLTATSDGAFTFPSGLANGSSYDVTVLSAPADQSCTVNNGTGIINGADVSDVAVSCGNWTHPSSLDDSVSSGAQQAGLPNFAMDNSGNAIIVWWQDGDILKSEYRDGAWAGPSYLSDNDGAPRRANDSGPPEVAMADNGDTIVVWEQHFNIFMSEYRNGVWSEPVWINRDVDPDGVEDYGTTAFDPQVAMDDEGNAIVAWRQWYYVTSSQVLKIEYRNGRWSSPSGMWGDISWDMDHYAWYAPHIAMDNNGNAIVAWEEYDYDTGYSLYRTEYRNGSWSAPSALPIDINSGADDEEADYTLSPDVSMSDNGEAIIVWWQSDGSDNQIFKSEYRGGAWTDPSSLADNISPDGAFAWMPKVAMDADGDAVIVWYQTDGVNKRIFMSQYREGVWTHPSSLYDSINPDGTDAWSPDAAMDSNGDAVTTWYQSDGDKQQIFKSEYRGGLWTHPSSLADNMSPDGKDAYYPEVAMDNNGDAIIVWWQGDRVYKSEYRLPQAE